MEAHVDAQPLLMDCRDEEMDFARGEATAVSSGSLEEEMHDTRFEYTPLVSKDTRTTLNQLGTFNGVYVPCLLNIIGVILFLRLGWAIGQAGVVGMLTIFFVAELQAILTVLSASAIASNGAMRGGGSYYLVSRSLGPEFGGSIGLQFYLLYASGVAMYLVGLAEEVEQTWFHDSPWGKRWVVITIATIALVSIVVIALIGAHAFSKVNQYLFIVQFACIAYGAIAICTVAPHGLVSGGEFTGPRSSTLSRNMYANYTNELHVCGAGNEVCDLAQVFAIVFPLATGFMEGLNLSGDLKHPGKSIPLGSLAAVATACVVYLTLIFLFGASFTGVTLRTNFTFFQEVGSSPYVVIVGVLVSCYTSGLGALFGASRILQAIARDDLFKGFRFLGQGSTYGDEPQNAVVFTAFLSLVFILIGDLDVIAPICTSFFCLVYAAVNFTALILQVTGVPNFRPTFRYSCWPLSLLGVAVNLAVMVYLNAVYAAVTFVVVSALFVYLYIAGPSTNWGNVSQALMYHQVRKYLLRLDSRNGHLKFWRPSVLFVPQDPRAATVQLCNRLKKGGLYIVGDIVTGPLTAETAAEANRRRQHWHNLIVDLKLKAIPHVLVAPTRRDGYESLMQCGGLGGLDINTVAFDWSDDEAAFDILHDALLLGKNVVLFRSCDRLDPTLLQTPPSSSLAIFPKRPKDTETIDVWMTDLSAEGQPVDSHVTLMLQLTHVLHSNPQWKLRPIRLFRVCEVDEHQVTQEKARLTALAADLRIPLDAANAHLVPLPRQLGPFHADDANTLTAINALMANHSKTASFVVVAMVNPLAFVNQPAEFAAHVEILTRNCPPTMLVWSANKESVITTCI
ncbi:unnamed protein product [Aphanomyces euteiches]|uniref:Amino acid permease/ SLC12A domain-containing protein n=3 Tax=Aphanomyces euteiches TaxID=100861 RepID=A0A6G0XTS5_9STRA|nr:hypothetical protein Ae201684_001649 [Aphanomyces euteiches]KAH9132483.1 hypothetical protein AeRB84_021129 [Aphanomyces euteiches]